MEVETYCGTRVQQEHFAQFAFGTTKRDVAGPTGEANLNDPSVMTLLAWIVYYFIQNVAETIDCPSTALFPHTPMKEWVTPSDLAFVVFILEHHVTKWRHLAAYRVQTGAFMSDEQSRSIKGLKYTGGIAGEDGKRRFDNLLVYFFTHFYGCGGEQATTNMEVLQEAVTRLVETKKKMETQMVVRSLSKEDVQSKEEVVNEVDRDVMHRVFYYINI
jgi:hypothetical protein